jgi:hypothetical protein
MLTYAGFSAAVGNIFQGDPFYKLGQAVIVELTGMLTYPEAC